MSARRWPLLLVSASCYSFDLEPVANHPPVAVADTSVDAATGALVTLDGSASTDSDGDALTFRWTQVETGADLVVLDDATSAIASFVAPQRGQSLFFRLTVHDGIDAGEPLIIQVRVNGAPTAQIGVVAAETFNGTPVFIVGQGTDPDDDPVTYFAWEVISAPPLGAVCLGTPSPCLEGEDTYAVTFTPPAKGDYVLELVVGDGATAGLPDSVLVRSLNRPPLALPQADRLIVSNHGTIVLDATASTDPDGDELSSYAWEVTAVPPGASVIMSPPAGDIATPTVELHGTGTYYVALVVYDDDGAASDAATLRLTTENNAPIAQAGVDRAAPNGTPLSLVSLSTDADGDPLTYTWTLIDSPPGGAVTLQDADQQAMTFTPSRKTVQDEPALCGPGECYVIRLTVSDGVAMTFDDVRVTSINRPPLAEAGPNQNDPGQTVFLDGTASYDADGDAIVSYVWAQASGPDVTGGVGQLTGATPTFTPSVPGTYVFDLVVEDAELSSAPDRVTITITKVNRPPILSVSAAQFLAAEATPFALEAGAADPDGDPVTVTWTRRSGQPTLFPATLVGTAPAPTAPSWTQLTEQYAGQNAAIYDVVASDGDLASAPQAVTLYVLPGASAVVVGGANANDLASPTCGSVSVPCATLTRAIEVVGGLDGSGDGRDIVLRAGSFIESTPTNNVFLTWPANTDLLGGREPLTFAPGGTSTIQCSEGTSAALRICLDLPPLVVGARLESIDVRFTSARANTEVALRCNGCTATIAAAALSSHEPSLPTAGAQASTAVLLASGAANLVVRDSTLSAQGSGGPTVAVDVRDGKLLLVDSQVHGIGPIVEADEAVSLQNGEVVLRRTIVVASGTAAQTTAIAKYGGSLLAESSVIAALGGGDYSYSLGILQGGGGGMTLLNNTFVGNGAEQSTAIYLGDPASLHANLFVGFTTIIDFVPGTSGLGDSSYSLIYGNAMAVPAGKAFFKCGGSYVLSIAEVNAASTLGCNLSPSAWSGNIDAACALVNPAGGDFHLNTALTNGCVAAAAVSSPAGTSPIFDLDDGPRPAPAGSQVDIGADEVP